MLAPDTISYFLFGLGLVVLFAVIIKYYYKRSRHENVESAKFRMLEDDDE